MTDHSVLRDRCAIVGVGNTRYTRGTDSTILELHLEATLAALGDAGLRPADIDAVIPNDIADRIAEEYMLNLGLPDLAYTATMHTGGASVISGIQSACLAIAAGVATTVLVVAGRRGYSQQRVSTGQVTPKPILAAMREFEQPFGNTVALQWFAHAAQRHMHEFGTTSEHFGHIAVAMRKYANHNGNAIMREKKMTIADHQASALIATPFRLFDCSLESDGAGAVVITSAARAEDLKQQPVLISGVGEGHGNPPTSITQKRDMTVIEGIQAAGRRAFAMAGMGPADIDVAEIYDAFTWIVLGSLEALGFCGRGEGGPFVAESNLELGGLLPTNTHGGLLSEAHVSGINHVIEAVRQLRRQVEPERQVPGCETALVTNEGDFHEGSALILRR